MCFLCSTVPPYHNVFSLHHHFSEAVGQVAIIYGFQTISRYVKSNTTMYIGYIFIVVEQIRHSTTNTIICDHMSFSTLFNVPFVGEFPPGHNCSFLLLTLPALVSENHPLTWFNIRSGVFLKLNPHRKTMISLLNRFIFTMISPAFEFSSELEIANPIKIS
jgi:hypothetical protein